MGMQIEITETQNNKKDRNTIV